MPRKGRQFFPCVTFSEELFSRKLRFYKKNDTLQTPPRFLYRPFAFASFQMASISSSDISIKFFPSLMVCASK